MHGLRYHYPAYTVPKDKLSNFLLQTQNRAKLLPAPNAYQKPMSWETKNGQFGKSAKRKTFLDEIQKWGKTTPSPALYKPNKFYKVHLGK